MARKKRRAIAERSLKVEAVRRDGGQAATTVHVEVERSALREEVGDDQVKRVVAAFPEPEGDGVRWREEEVRHTSEAPQQPERAVERYSGTHYGPSEPGYGVKVELETQAGRVAGQAPGESFTVRDAGEPAECHRVRHPTAPRRRK